MAATKVTVGRMTTSREGPTKYEHFVTLWNDQGKSMDMGMHYEPTHALYEALALAKHLGVPCSDLVIDGTKVELDDILMMMLEGDDDVGTHSVPRTQPDEKLLQKLRDRVLMLHPKNTIMGNVLVIDTPLERAKVWWTLGLAVDEMCKAIRSGDFAGLV